MKKSALLAAFMLAAMSDGAWLDREPPSKPKHDPERLNKAQKKRERKARRRIKEAT